MPCTVTTCVYSEAYHPTLDTHLVSFVKSVHQLLSNITRISPLRFQNPEVTYDDTYTYFIATVVEQSPSLGKQYLVLCARVLV